MGHANGSISPIFDKEKEQKRLQMAQMAGEIAGQMSTIVQTQGDINGLEAAKEKHPGYTASQLRDTGEYKKAQREFGTGGKWQMVTQSVGGILSGLAGGNAMQAAAGALNPWVAQVIKKETTDENNQVNVAANAAAHAVWGAVAAQMAGGNAAAGAAGAFSGELAVRYIAEQRFGADTQAKIDALSEDQRQELSLMSTLAAGLAGGLAGSSTASATTGAQAGKNAVENNFLSDTDIKNFVEKYAAAKTDKEKEKLVGELKDKDAEQQAQALATAIPVNKQKEELEKLKALGASSNCTTQCQQLVKYSILQLEPVANDSELHRNNLSKAVLASVIMAFATDRPSSVKGKASQSTAAAAGKAETSVIDDIVKGGSQTGKVPNFNPNEIRFSQNTVSYNKTERGTGVKYTYNDLVSSMKSNGWKGDPIDVVKMPDGKMTSMDNTRINAARDAGINVEANVRSFNDPLPKDMIDSGRFGSAITWGEAITGRINNQSGGFSKNNPYGSTDSPRITGKGK